MNRVNLVKSNEGKMNPFSKYTDDEIDHLLNSVTVRSQFETLQALKRALSSMKSDSDSMKAQSMNRILDEVYYKTLEELN